MSGPGIKLFISHSSKDKAVAEHLVELLRVALDLQPNEIRCTSVDGYRLSGGAYTEEQLRREVMEAPVCIWLISPASMDSLYVALELGARWGADLLLIPLLAPGIEPDILEGPLGDRHALQCTPPQLHQLIEEVAEHLGTRSANRTTYESYVVRVVDSMPEQGNMEESAVEQKIVSEDERDAPEHDWSSLVLFMPEQGDYVLVSSRRIESDRPRDPWTHVPRAIDLEFIPDGSRSAARIADLRSTHDSIRLAYGSDAFVGRVTEARQIRAEGEEIWQVRFEPQDRSFRVGFMEVSMEGYSADDIAELRARRILLDEVLSDGQHSAGFGGSALASLVEGMDVPLHVEHSPFPALFGTLGTNPSLFLAACRLFGVLYLRLSGTIEHVYRLDFRIAGADALHVYFEGQRHRLYDNVEPMTIRIEGVCPLTR